MAHRIRCLVAVFVAIALLPNRDLAQAATAGAPQSEIVIISGTVAVDQPLQDALRAAFNRTHGSIPIASYYAVTNIQRTGDWFLVSVAGFNHINADQTWSFEDDAVWAGLVLVTQNPDGTWSSAVEGVADFTTLLARVPENVMNASTKVGLDPLHRPRLPAEAYRFPWQTGTSMQYGTLGVHPGDYTWLVGDYKAVDMLSDANTALGHAPNRLLAAASGTIDYVCSDGTNVAIRIGQLLYVHLVLNANLTVGHTFNQGDELGQLKTGTFSANCGHADQGANWFHVHWAFPNTGSFQAGGWTLTFADQTWHRGTETRVINDWLLAENPVWHVEYFGDKTLTTRCYEAYENATYVFKQWDANPPAAGCPAGNFGARFTQQVVFQGGAYAFHVEHDDGARLYLDGQPVIDAWHDGSSGNDVTRILTGTHEVKIEYYAATGSAALGAWWYGPGALPTDQAADPAAWHAEYYGYGNLWGRPALAINEGSGAIIHDWGSSGPGYGLPGEYFGARFSRTLNFPCGHYQFSIHVDDGVRLWVGGQLLLDQWQDQVADFHPEIDLEGGSLPVKVEYYQRGWGAALSMDWQVVSTTLCLENKPDLRPFTLAGKTLPVVPSSIQGTHVTGTLYAGQPTYFDWHFINDGYASTTGDFAAEVWIDGNRIARNSYFSMEPGMIGGVNDWATVVVTPGWHMVKLVIDPDNIVAESDETNNTWQGSFYWQAGVMQGPAVSSFRVFLPASMFKT